MEERREVHEGTLARFLDMSIDLLAILALDTTVLEASRSWQTMLGWSPDEVIGQRLLELFHPDDLDTVQHELATVLRGDDAVSVPVRIRAADGSYRWVQGNARADLAAGQIFVTAADISARMELEATLRQQADLEEVVASIASRLIGVDPDAVIGEIEQAMGELAEALGADRAHFLRGARHADDVTYVEWLRPGTGQRAHAPAPDPEVQRWWREVLRSGRLLNVEDVATLRAEAPLVVDALDGEGVRSVLLLPLPLHGRFWGFLSLVALRHQVHFSDDASALLRLVGECFMSALAQRDSAVALLDAQRELRHRNDELERSNEELERFAYAAAHDLKAPLSRVEMALASSSAEGAPPPELLDIARRGAARMRQLIEDLLAFSAVGRSPGEAGPVDLDEVLTQVLSDVEALVRERGATVERGPLPTVIGHQALLSQLVANLLANSLKYTRRGVAPLIRVEAATGDGGTVLTVADNGIGIEPAHREEVFGVFTRLDVDDPQPGSGIGLATCAKVVHHHGGRIWIDDGIDGGTAVRVWLPAAR